MKEKGLTSYALNTRYNVSKAQLYRLKHNQSVSTNTLDKLCNILDCGVSDIMEHIPDDNVF